ncbi:MAG: branched-chain amino acid ABC transporter permease [Thermofilum sp. ex4484_15]|nr:MAG: branched-chain amino acid ABC transporter permease [Thermofilum sp. ex4484_15]
MKVGLKVLKFLPLPLWFLALVSITRNPIRFFIDLASFYSFYLMLSVSLNLEYGYTGIPNFGKVMFFAGGAFVTGSLTARLIAPLAGVNSMYLANYKLYNVIVGTQVSTFFAQRADIAMLTFLLMLILGAVVGALLGLVASYPAIRLREDYLAMTLIVTGELLRIIARNYDPLICGTIGVFVPDPFRWLTGLYHDLVRTGVMLGIAFSSWAFVEALVRSPFGRMIRAIRENEVVAEAFGKDVTKVRMQVLMVGSAIAGVAGALYAFYAGTVQADDFMPIRTFVVWVMVILGGAGNNAGAALGALTYLALDRTIVILKRYFTTPFDINNLSYIALGLALVLTLMYRPEGLIPEKPIILKRVRRANKPGR